MAENNTTSNKPIDITLSNDGIKGVVPQSVNKKAALELDSNVPKLSQHALENSYIDERIIQINRKSNTSLYIQKNLTDMPIPNRALTPTIMATQQILTNVKEIEAYMPMILGMGANNPNFVFTCKQYFENIYIEISDNGLPLNVSFNFNTGQDYLNYIKSLNSILAIFTKADKSNSRKRDAAFARRDEAIIKLESEQYKYGKPINYSDYMAYRYALLSSKVANDISMVDATGEVLFYIEDKRLEANRKAYTAELQIQSHEAFLNVIKDESMLDNILYANNTPNITNMSKAEKIGAVDILFRNNPTKLVELATDKRISDKAFIERLIIVGLLKRYGNTNIIINTDGETIGNNIDDTIAYLNNPTNASTVSMWKTKLNSKVY